MAIIRSISQNIEVQWYEKPVMIEIMEKRKKAEMKLIAAFREEQIRKSKLNYKTIK